MIIENPDAFKSWLTSILEPLCDADPAALAKYVYALVKKDKPLAELREGMLDQLDVFLQHETKPFVDMLFKSLETQEYLKSVHVEETIQDGEKQPSPEPEPEVEKVDEAPVHGQIKTQEYLESGYVAKTDQGEEKQASSGPEAGQEKMDEAPGHETNGKAMESSDRLSPVHPSQPPPPPRHRLVVRSKPLPPVEQTLVKASLPLTELLEEPVDQPPRRRDRRGDSGPGADRRRRRSRSWERRVGGVGGARRRHRDISHERTYGGRRGASRSPSPRPRYRNRSPPPPPPAADRQPTRSRSRSPTGVGVRDRERDRLLRLRETERDRASRDREHRDRHSRERDRSRDRSRERSASPLPERSENTDGYNKRRCRDFDEKGYCMRGDLCQWDHGADPVVLEDVCRYMHLAQPQPQPPEYNPLTPDIWSGSAPPHAAAPLPPGVGRFPPFPPPPPHHLHPHPHPRELIPIPRVRHELPPGLAAPLMPLPPRLPPPKKNFDYARLGPVRAPPLPANAANCSLEVKKVPRGLNDITHLNNHFSKFGKIVNIQVCFGGDPEGALITFSSPAEANVAYKSTEAVLNNRFIKVFWHNPENKQENASPNTQQAKNPERGANQHPLSHNKVLVNRVQPQRDVTAACAAAKLQQQTENTTEPSDPKLDLKSESKKENMTSISKPVPKALPAGAPAGAPAGGKAVMEMHKRAQALLETQIHQQLLLIQRLESGNVSGAARAALLEAINSAQEGIEKLRAELLAYNKALRLAAMQEDAAGRLSRLHLQKKPKTREEAQKEILDAELDMFTKQQEGQDITDLAKKIADLRRQMATQFPSHPAHRRLHSRGGRFSTSRIHRASAGLGGLGGVGGAAGGKVFNNQVVDHRPRALLISGFEPDELDSLVAHFAQYGEITGKEVNLSVPELTLQFAARAHAEQAAQRARNYSDRTLSITWVANNKPIGGGNGVAGVGNAGGAVTSQPAPVPTPAAQNGDADSEDKEMATASADLLLEEEEDDEQEDRSWRR